MDLLWDECTEIPMNKEYSGLIGLEEMEVDGWGLDRGEMVG